MQFETDFNRLYPDFLRRLSAAHPHLSAKDLTLCALLVMRCDSKEIASFLDLSPHSVDARRSKLRKELNLAHSDGLSHYLLGFTSPG